jgi:hypothetical protein
MGSGCLSFLPLINVKKRNPMTQVALLAFLKSLILYSLINFPAKTPSPICIRT